MDKIALVTGSTSNVGKGTAEVLSKDGYLVIVTSRHGSEAKEVAEKLPKKGTFYQVDYSNTQEIDGGLRVNDLGFTQESGSALFK